MSTTGFLRLMIYLGLVTLGFLGIKIFNKKPEIKARNTQELDAYIQQFVDCGQFSGSVFVARGGHIVLNKGYGYANVENKQPTTPTTKYWLASCTKQFTAMAIMILMEKGFLDVHDTLSQFLPDYPRGNEITIHQLLTHSSGIPDCFNDPTLDVQAKQAKSMNVVIDSFKNVSLTFTPGSQFSYSNSGYILLSAIIEEICKKNNDLEAQTFDEFLTKYIFMPLQMHNTQFGKYHDTVQNRAQGYIIAGHSMQQPALSGFIEQYVPMGYGTLCSTVEDLYKWDRALYSETLVSKATLDKIMTPYLNNYGYGWHIDTQFGKAVMKHDGNSDSTYAHISRFIEDDVCIIILCNYSNAPIGTLSAGLAAQLFGYEAEEPKAFVRGSRENLSQLTGYYKGNNGSYLVTAQDEKLFFNEIGCVDTFELLPTTRDTFLDASNLDIEISFKKEQNGSAEKMTVLHDGYKVSALKTT